MRHHPPFWREPLLHFVLLGAALFALHGWWNDRGTLGADTIVIDRGKVKHLAADFARLHQRPPTAPELQGLVDDAIREEVFYREAIAQGLDRDDAIVRRRMVQKLEFAAQEIDPIPEPTEAQLQAWLDGHPVAFVQPPRYTFRQVYLDPRLHGASLESDAGTLLANLRAAGPRVDSAGWGDPLLLPHRQHDVPADEVRKQFGAAFADALERFPMDRWQGPVTSGFGAHLVLLERRVPGRSPALSQVRDDVRREWTHAQQQARNARHDDRLRKRYDVRVDMPDAAQ